MRPYRFLKVLKIVLLIVVGVSLLGFVVMHLWNWLMPALFSLRPVTFWQALGLLLLGKLLFGGFRPGRGGRFRGRWEQMSPEERERFRMGMRGRRGCPFTRPSEEAPSI